MIKTTRGKIHSLIKFSTGLLLSSLFSVTSVNAGGTLDLSLSDDTVRLAIDAAQLGSGLHLSLALQHEEDKGDILSIAGHVVDIRDNKSNLFIGVGGNTYLVSSEQDDDGIAVGVGGFFRYVLPGIKDTSIAGYGYYAPPVVSFADIRNLYDIDVRLQYNLIPTARIYVGYRDTSVAFDGRSGRNDIGSGFHFGLKLDF